MNLYDRANGQWQNILVALGVEPRYLTGKHGPCPFCGGRDRWRFTDFNGDGLFICNQCGNGNGVTLAMRYFKLSFREAARLIEEVIGNPSSAPPPTPSRKRDQGRIKRDLHRLWSDAHGFDQAIRLIFIFDRAASARRIPKRCDLRCRSCISTTTA